MKKIFPFYKGKNISKNPLGYTNIANARKRMDDKEVLNDFKNTLPKDYWIKHYIVYELENPWIEQWMNNIKGSEYGIFTTHYWYNITIYTHGYIVISSKKYIEELPQDIRGLFIKLHKLESLAIEDYKLEHTTYKEEYKMLLYKILSNGYYPSLHKDDNDFKKRYSKFITNNVEFKEMDINIQLNDYDKTESN